MDKPKIIYFDTLIKIYGAFNFLNNHDVPKLPTTADETAPAYETNFQINIYYMLTFHQ